MVKEKGEGENTLCLSWPFGFAVMNPSVSRKSLILSTSSSWQITVRSLNPSALFLLPFFCNIIKTGLKLGKFLVLQECRRDPLQRVVFTEETTAPSLLYLLCHCLFKPAMRKTQAQAYYHLHLLGHKKHRYRPYPCDWINPADWMNKTRLRSFVLWIWMQVKGK